MKLSDFKDDPSKLIGLDVLINTRYAQSLSKIAKVTKRHIILENGDAKYRIESGYLATSDTWNIPFIQLLTKDEAEAFRQEVKDKAEAEALRESIAYFIKSADLSQLRKLNYLINSHTKNQ